MVDQIARVVGWEEEFVARFFICFFVVGTG